MGGVVAPPPQGGSDMPPPTRQPRHGEAELAKKRKREKETEEFAAARKKQAKVDPFAVAGLNGIVKHACVKAFKKSEKTLGEVKDGTRSIAFLTVREKRPAGNPRPHDTLPREQRRCLSVGASLLLKIQSVRKSVVSWQTEARGKTKRARTGMRADAVLSIARELYEAAFEEDEARDLVIVLKGVAKMTQNAGEKEEKLLSRLAHLAHVVAFRFEKLEEMSLMQALEAISYLGGLPDAPAEQLMLRLGHFIQQRKGDQRVQGNYLAMCLDGMGKHKDTKAARFVISCLARLFDSSTVIGPRQAFGWVENFAESPEIKEILEKLVTAVRTWMNKTQDLPNREDVQCVRDGLKNIANPLKIGGLQLLMEDLESSAELT